MDEYLEYVSHVVTALHRFAAVRVVMGNESCDLDSCISALVYAYLLHSEVEPSTAVIPLLNILQRELLLRTEVTYFLRKNGIPLDRLVFRDTIELRSLLESGQLQLTLVDHHVLSSETEGLCGAIVEVVDHHPQDPAWRWTEQNVILATVGSCATLVANQVLTRRPHLLDVQAAALLYGPIVLDTACFSAAAERTTELDLQVVAQLEARGAGSQKREELFSELLAAQSDVSTLSPGQLLLKDMKVASGIPVPGLPILVREFLTRPNVMEALKEFCAEMQTNIVVVMGLHIEGGVIQRDIAVFHVAAPEAAHKLVECLKSSTDPVLQLEDVSNLIPGLQLFKQLNVKASRKQVLPVVRECVVSKQ
ncbi:exopolyphosphatase PRUNE1-like isoform X1 [Periplaneta americana]|uniref:exopolyphosphatase PRUNE1-like isoform X1 n=2 Tax=Periplaneta americana TaxID=6978 RepID=UPI0037E8D1BA